MKNKIEIKNRFDDSVLFSSECEDNTLLKCVQEANLQYADLQYANLQGADLKDANLRGALIGDIKIKKAIVFTGIYNYIAIPIIAEDDKQYVKLGCHLRSVEEWEKDFWNNNNEFPNDNSVKSQLRVLAYDTCKRWIEINK